MLAPAAFNAPALSHAYLLSFTLLAACFLCVPPPLSSLIAVALSAFAYGVRAYFLSCKCVVEPINELAPIPRFAALAGLAIALALVALLVGLSTFAAYMYFLARAWTPSKGNPEEYLSFNSKMFAHKWSGRPIPVEVH